MIGPTDSASSWARRLATFRTQAGKRTRGAEASDVTEEALSMCEALIRELAGAQLTRDQLRADLRVADAAWDHLFHVMPSACVVTDSGGVILNANRAASRLLNVSATHLKGRELLVFSQDRETCRALLDEMERNRRTELRARVMLRPRERKPIATELHVAAAPGRENAWLWIITPATANATPSLEIVPPDQRLAPLSGQPVNLRAATR
jgi:PAS domain S-box-containing protein